MKRIIKSLFVLLIKIASIFYSYPIHSKIIAIKNILFSTAIKRLLKECGKGFSVRSPLYLIGPQYISIGENFGALERFRIECWDFYFSGQKFNPRITIGNNVAIGYNVHIGCINEIRIGNNVLMASNIFIEDCSHGYVDERDNNIPPLKRELYSKGPIVIGDNVWIGENVAILPNVTIGVNAIIGANSVVTKNVPANSVVGGNPARLIKKLWDS